ncbi:MAG: hypothetical protein DMD82_01655 [Candidatus Rokuibacteriota bacterium]|nr:MAG: hypothetical protein DMD82_01655 [Candidatus Rokubacteria bacterium]
MHETVASPLEAWGSFYVIVGSSAGALTGLQFVVMTLIAQTELRGRGEAVSAFGTPNVVHFCAALLVASILTVPWSALRPAGLAVAGCGVLGSVYSVVVLRRAHRQREYQPVFEDWLWHTILPALAYAALFVAGALLGRNWANALFVIGAAALLLVFVGIHNAWDTVTYVTIGLKIAEQEPGGGARGGAEPAADGGAEVRAGAGAEVPAGTESARGSSPETSGGGSRPRSS